MAEDGAVRWMAEHGHPGYANAIEALQATKDEVIGDAGRYWQLCPFTQDALKKIDAEIAEVKRCAWERYEDWRTDPLD